MPAQTSTHTLAVLVVILVAAAFVRGQVAPPAAGQGQSPADAQKKESAVLEMDSDAPYAVIFDIWNADYARHGSPNENGNMQFVVEVVPQWAPLAAKRFKKLVDTGYYDGNRFFRVIEGFCVQWGLNGDPNITRQWDGMQFKDETPKVMNKKGTIAFAMSGPNTRNTQVFINWLDNPDLDEDGYVVFGKVTEGMENIEESYFDYNEYGQGPSQPRIKREGNKYLKQEYPRLTYIVRARVHQPENGRAVQHKVFEGATSGVRAHESSSL